MDSDFSADGQSTTLYVVDDDPAVRASMQALLECHDFHVLTYGSAREFLDAREQVSASGCLIADLHMPEMDGLQLIATLRNRGDHIPAIVITGKGDSLLRDQALKAGAFVLLDKPVEDKRLCSEIARAMAGRHT